MDDVAARSLPWHIPKLFDTGREDERKLISLMESALSKDGAESNMKLSKLAEVFANCRSVRLNSEWASAMAEAQAEMNVVHADQVNKQNRTTYASLAAIDDAIRGIYTKNGFAPTFRCDRYSQERETVTVILELGHVCGLTKHYEMELPADGKGLKGNLNMLKTHAIGSAFTYAQRYLLKLAFNVVTDDAEDDDGNGSNTKTIDAAQLKLLAEKIREAGIPVEKFLEYYKLDALQGLPELLFEAAISKLNMTIKAKNDQMQHVPQKQEPADKEHTAS